MSDVIELNPLENQELICDLARFQESLLTERQLRRKHKQYQEADWQRFGGDESLVSAVELESLRRVRSGESKKEKAALHVVKGVDVLGEIAMDASQSARHRVDAVKALDSMSGSGPDAASQDSSRFVISIHLGADTETYSKQIEVGVENKPPDDNVVVIPAKKTKRIAKKQEE
jgi:hypothetical protein